MTAVYRAIILHIGSLFGAVQWSHHAMMLWEDYANARVVFDTAHVEYTSNTVIGILFIVVTGIHTVRTYREHKHKATAKSE